MSRGRLWKTSKKAVEPHGNTQKERGHIAPAAAPLKEEPMDSGGGADLEGGNQYHPTTTNPFTQDVPGDNR